MAYTANEARYSAMQYARSGRSGLALPRVALGLWHNFGSQDVFDTMRETLCAAFDSGITYFDLANNYGPVPGSAEENFGRILHGELAAHRDELVVATKAGYRMWPGPYGNGGSRKAMLASLDQSLARMRLSYVDIFYSHRMDPETPLEETMGALASAVRQGKALYAGLSNYDGETAARAAALLEAGGCPFVVCQNRYSMLDRTVEHNGLLAFARGAGKGVVAFSPLAQGLLSGRYLHGIPQGSRIARGNSVRMTPQALTPALMQGLENWARWPLRAGRRWRSLPFRGCFRRRVSPACWWALPARHSCAKTLPALRPRRFRRKSARPRPPFWAEAVCKTCRFCAKTLCQV